MEGNLVEEEALAELGNSVGVISIPSSGAGLVSQPGPLGFIWLGNHPSSMAGTTTNMMHLLEFFGKGDSDAEQRWFLYELIWRAKGTIAPYVKVVEFKTTFTLRGRALQWFMKFVQTDPQVSTNTLDEVKTILIAEF